MSINPAKHELAIDDLETADRRIGSRASFLNYLNFVPQLAKSDLCKLGRLVTEPILYILYKRAGLHRSGFASSETDFCFKKRGSVCRLEICNEFISK
jgi:hypothetical protein